MSDTTTGLLASRAPRALGDVGLRLVLVLGLLLVALITGCGWPSF